MGDREQNGKFKKGHGISKPKGSVSKKTLAWEKLGEFIINEGADRYMELLLSSEDKAFAEEFRNILEYFKPKQQRTEIKGEIITGAKLIGFDE